MKHFKKELKTRFAKKYRISKGDQVIVISGNHKGKKGVVIDIDRQKDRLSIAGVAKIKKHVKRGNSRNEGAIEERDAYLHISNVMFFESDAECPTRIGFRKGEQGRERYSVKTGKKINKNH